MKKRSRENLRFSRDLFWRKTANVRNASVLFVPYSEHKPQKPRKHFRTFHNNDLQENRSFHCLSKNTPRTISKIAMINSMTLYENSEIHKIAPTNAAAASMRAVFPPFLRFRFFGQRILFTSLSLHNIPKKIFCYCSYRVKH